MTPPATQPARLLLPCVCGCEDTPPPEPPKINGHPTKAKVAKLIDFSKVSRSTTARLLLEARRLARG